MNRCRNKTVITKNININGHLVSDSKEINLAFNSYFIEIGTKLSQELPNFNDKPTTYLNNLNSSPLNSIMLQPTDASEIIDIVKKLKNKSSAGFDNINPKILKTSIYSIVNPIVNIMNSSISTGIVPDSLKLAKVIPIHKKGEKNCLNNYRPISILPTFSKILEKIIHKRLYKFLTNHNIITQSQYGFRPKLSTEHAVLDLQNSIINNLDKNNTSIAVFLDLSKAFDTINHTILLNKLKYYGIRGLALKWFESYLSNRKQYTSTTPGNDSTTLNIKTGVPQGSILGPLLFIIYINDFQSSIKASKIIHYADDTSILFNFEHNTSIKNIESSLSKNIKHIHTWLSINKLSLNLAKTKCVLFSKKGNRPLSDTPNIEINNIKIEFTSNFCFLGITFNQHLEWKPHIELLCNKIAKTIYSMKQIKNIVNKGTLRVIYNALVLPHISYCISAWFPLAQINLKRLNTLQKQALRTIHNAKYLAHTEQLFRQSNILKIEDLFKLSCLSFFDKHLKQNLPQTIDVLLTPRHEIHSHNTRQHTSVFLNPIQSNLSKQGINYKIWKISELYNKSFHQIKALNFNKLAKKIIVNSYSKVCNKTNCISCPITQK